MGFFNKEVELIIPPKKQTNKTIKVKSSLNGYDAIREKLDEGTTTNPVKTPVEQPRAPKTKVSIGL